MFKEVIAFYKNAFISLPSLALLVYFFLFLILLKNRSVKLSINWFIPFFPLYFGLLFATLFSIFVDGEISSSYLTEKSLFDLVIEAFNPLNGRGKVMFGGYFGSIVGILIANSLFKRKSLSKFLDISAISISFLFAIWRIGCFLSGCCYGYQNDTLGISFPKGTQAFRELRNTSLAVGNSTVPLLPTQLISSFGDFAIFLFLLTLFRKNKTKYPYFYFFAQALLYGIGRFTIEFFRIDPREFWGPLSMSQWLSLVLIFAGLIFFIKNRKEITESFRQSNA